MGHELGWSEGWQERIQARVTPSGEISDHLREKLLKSCLKNREYIYSINWISGKRALMPPILKQGEIINLATGTLTSVRCFAQRAAEILNISADKLSFGSIPTRPEEMYHSEVSLLRLKKIIGWVPPTNINEGIQKTHAFEDRSPVVRDDQHEQEY